MKNIFAFTPLILLSLACATELPESGGPSDGSSGNDTENGLPDVPPGGDGEPGVVPPGDGDTGVPGDGDTSVPGDGDTSVPGDGDTAGPGDGDVPEIPGSVISPRGSRFCEDERLFLGEIHLFGNEWTDLDADTCVFLDADGSFGIDWTRGNTGSGDNPGYPNYPEAEFGINPWGGGTSTTTLLPLQLKDFTSASMTLDVTTTTDVNSGWNLAFELWLSDTDPTLGPANPKGEIMIFLGNEPNYWPHDAKGGTFNDGHNTFTLYESSDDWGTWGIYRQWRVGDTDGRVDFNGTLDIYAFLKHHMEAEGWDPNLWVTRFEIGNETFQNSGGETRFRSLSFEVNGETRSAVTE